MSHNKRHCEIVVNHYEQTEEYDANVKCVCNSYYFGMDRILEKRKLIWEHFDISCIYPTFDMYPDIIPDSPLGELSPAFLYPRPFKTNKQ